MAGYIGQRKNEMEGVSRRWFEVEMEVETPSIVVLGMNEKASDADGPGCGQGRFYGGLKWSRTKPSASELLVYGHSRQDDSGNGIKHIAADSTPHVAVGDRSVGKRVKPNDSAIIDHDVRLRAAGDLVCHGPLSEPLV